MYTAVAVTDRIVMACCGREIGLEWAREADYMWTIVTCCGVTRRLESHRTGQICMEIKPLLRGNNHSTSSRCPHGLLDGICSSC